MKGSVVLALVSMVYAGSAFAADTYQCEGKYDLKGSVTLTVSGSKITVVGEYSDPNVDATVMTKVNCTAKLTSNHPGAAKGYDYYDTTSSRGCPADFIGVSDELEDEGRGALKLVQTSGGDTHDNSGYQYAFFTCKSER